MTSKVLNRARARATVTGASLLSSVFGMLATGCASSPGEEVVNETAQASTGQCQQGGIITGTCTTPLEQWSDAPIGTRLLVVGPNSLRAPSQHLVAHKNAHGMPAFFMSMESARATIPSGDDAATIKRLIQILLEQRGIQYVLIAGDASLMPARHTTLYTAPGYPQPTTVQYQSTDNYYANVYRHTVSVPGGVTNGAFSNWDANANGKYDEGNADQCNFACSNGPDAVDAYPDVAVGRVPAHDAVEMANYVTKVIRYETGQMVHPLNAFTAVADGDLPLLGTQGIIRSFQNGAALTQNPGVRVLDVAVGFAAGTVDPGFIAGSINDVNFLVPGATWFTYVGHGAPSGWAIGEDAGLVSALRNEYALPVVWANACATGRFKVNTYGYGDSYIDKNGTRHLYSVTEADATKGIAGSAMDYNTPLSYPFTPAEPNIYSGPDDRDLTIATSWLVKSKAGAIAYFGETLSRPDDEGAELEGLVVASLQSSASKVLGDAWLLGQRLYWARHIGSTDIFWNPRDYLTVMTMFGDPSLRFAVPTQGRPRPRHVAGDFDGDGFADVAVFRPSIATWGIQRSSLGAEAVYFGVAGDVPVPGDYDGDGQADVAVWRPSTGVWYITTSSGGTFVGSFGALNDVAVPQDYDGDGKHDIAVFRPATGVWYLNQSTAGGKLVTFGQAGDVAVPADYDGDGRVDVAVFRPSTGVWYLNQSTAGGKVVTFGQAGDVAVPADYDGDGNADVAVFRPSTGAWYLNQSTAGGKVLSWGQAGDIAIPSDYDGDGKTDVAVFDPSRGQFFLNQSTGLQVAVTLGQIGDIPVSGVNLVPAP